MLTIRFDNSYARELQGLYVPWRGAAVPEPRLVLLNEGLARELGLAPEALRSPAGLAMLTGAAMPEGAAPLAMAYAGHQFGGFSPQLGDGRALLVGEVIDRQGRRRDLHLKGSGPTPFSRGGDGKAALGPVLREYLIGEAMQGLGIPTTRALAAVATGETVWRETALPGAVLARVAASHIRVGTFQFFMARRDLASLRRLADHAIRRHDPALADAPDRYLAFLRAVIARQMALVAQWMAAGFVHGVMNTDNCAVSGETIDYGPCAFLDGYDEAAVFSSIDRHGRYAYGRQPVLAQWNLARLAETLLPLVDDAPPEAALPRFQAAIEEAPEIYHREWLRRFAAKLGLGNPVEGDEGLIRGFLNLMAERGADFTLAFREAAQAARGEPAALAARLGGAAGFDDWLGRWLGRLAREPGGAAAAAARMDAVNPLYIARNHLVEAALEAAHRDDLTPARRLLDAFADPFTERPGLEDLTRPAPPGFGPYVTFCGT